MGRKNKRKVQPRHRLPTAWEVNHNLRTGTGRKPKPKSSLTVEQPKVRASTDEVKPKRMEVWYARLYFDEDTCIQGGDRPVLIISNDENNDAASTVNVIPMTSRKKRPNLPVHVWINNEIIEGLSSSSMVLAEQITTIDKKQLAYRIGVCNDKKIQRRIERAIRCQLDMEEN